MKEKILILLIATTLVGCSEIIDNKRSLNDFSEIWQSDMKYRNLDNLSIMINKLNAISDGINTDTIITYLGKPTRIEDRNNVLVFHYDLYNDVAAVSFDNNTNKLAVVDDDDD